MSSSLSSLSDNLAKGLHKDKCKNCKSDLESIMAYWYSNVSTARKMMMKNSKNIQPKDWRTPTDSVTETLKILFEGVYPMKRHSKTKKFYRNLTIDFRIQNSVESHDL